MAAARRLRAAPDPEEQRLASFVVVDPDSGERVGTYGDLTQQIADELAGAERDLRGWRARYADLQRDKEAEAQESPVWPSAVEVFDYWRLRCKHPGAEWDLKKFELICPHLERSNTGKGKAKKLTPELIARNVEICKLAVDGIAFDPYVTIGKNGRPIVHDGLHLVFGDSTLLEKRCKMAPVERIHEVFGKGNSASRRHEPEVGNGGSSDHPSSPADLRGADGAPGGSQQDPLWQGGAQTGNGGRQG